MGTLLIVLLVLFVLGGGGWGYARWRRERPAGVLSHMTEHRKVAARTSLILQHMMFTCGLKKATLRQNSHAHGGTTTHASGSRVAAMYKATNLRHFPCVDLQKIQELWRGRAQRGRHVDAIDAR
jgi:hypothetical protein